MKNSRYSIRHLYYSISFFLFFLNSFSIKAQKWEWLQTIRPGGDEYVWDMTTDSKGNVIATGRVKATSTFGWAPNTVTPPWHSGNQTDAFLVKYRPNGTMVWAKRDGGKEQDWGRGITTDTSGNIFVTGEFRDTAYFAGKTVYSVIPGTVANMYLAKYDSLGNCLWVAQAGNTTQSTIGHGVTLDEAGNIYITGFVNGVSNFGNGITAGTAGRHLSFVAKYSPTGICQWVRVLNASVYGNGNDIVYSKEGYLYNTGEFKGKLTVNGIAYVGTGSTYEELYTCKMDVNGNFIWAAIAKGNGTDLSNRIETDDNDNVYVTGQFEYTVTFAPGISVVSNNANDAFLVKYNKNGDVKWATAVVGAGNDYSSDVKVYKNKDIIISGHVAVGPFTIGSSPVYNCGGSWSIVVCFDTLGAPKWYKLGGGTGINNSKAVSTDTSGNIFSGGFFNTNLVLDTIVTTSPGPNGYDCSIAKLFPPISPVVTSTNPQICFGSHIKYNVSQAGSPITYQWSFPGGTPSTSTAINPDITYSTPGIYNVQLITKNHHETDTLFLTSYVTVNTFPVVNLGTDATLCEGTALTLNAGPGMSSYLWNDNSNSQTLSVSNTGQYYVTGTNACGSAHDTISIISIPAPVVNIGRDTSICQGESLTLNAGPGMSIYTWDDNSSGQLTSVSSSGQHYVIVTGPNGCSSSDTLNLTVLPLPTVDLGPDTTICSGNPYIIDAGAGMINYEWNNNTFNQTLNATVSGQYSVNVKDVNGCSSSDTLILTVNPAPALNLGVDTSICIGQSLSLDAGNNMVSYLWNDSSTTQIITVSIAGQYSVNVLDVNGCFANDTIQLSVNQPPVIDLGADTTICQGELIILNGGAGMNSYQWNDLSTSQTLNAGIAGQYYVNVIDNNGCSSSDSMQLNVNPSPVVNLGADTIICDLIIDTLDAGSGYSSYLWNDGTIGQILPVSSTDQYYVMVSNSFGCTASDSVEVVVDICTGIKPEVNNYEVSVYPNPVTDHASIIVNGPEFKSLIFDLFNSIGEKVISSLSINKGETILNVQELPKGIYFYRLQSDGHIIKNGRIVIQ